MQNLVCILYEEDADVARRGGNVTVNATFEMDGEVVGRKVIKYHNGVVVQTGKSPLLV